MMWVLVNDETSEPYEIGHRQWKGKVKRMIRANMK
jgi:hypothetical protein